MSSDYLLICLSHDPAMEIENPEWRNQAEPIELLRNRDACPGAERDGVLGQHPTCDLVVGRYSAALIEVCCVGGGGDHGPHFADKWIDVNWLRLLWAANELPGDRIGCWSRARAGRLRQIIAR